MKWRNEPPDMPEECLKEIPEYEGMYSAHASGHIWSHTRKDCSGRVYSGIWMKEKITRSGYAEVTLCKNRQKKTFRVHRLIAQVFCDNDAGFDQVNHIDGDKLNNSSSNLEWCSGSQNRKHAWEIGLSVVTQNMKNSGLNLAKQYNVQKRILTFAEAIEMRLIYGQGGVSLSALGKRYGISESSTHDIIKYKTYRENIAEPEEEE